MIRELPFAAVLLYAVARGALDHLAGRPDVASRAEDARGDLKRREMEKRIDDVLGSIEEHLRWLERMQGGYGWSTYAGHGPPWEDRPWGYPGPVPHGRAGVMCLSKREPLTDDDVRAMQVSPPRPRPWGSWEPHDSGFLERHPPRLESLDPPPTRLDRDVARGWVIHHLTEGGMRIWRRTANRSRS